MELPYHDVVRDSKRPARARPTQSESLDRAWKVAPALACGCTIVMKPSEFTPLTALVSPLYTHASPSPASLAPTRPSSLCAFCSAAAKRAPRPADMIDLSPAQGPRARRRALQTAYAPRHPRSARRGVSWRPARPISGERRSEALCARRLRRVWASDTAKDGHGRGPAIVRLWGRPEAVHRRDSRGGSLVFVPVERPGARAVITAPIARRRQFSVLWTRPWRVQL